MQEGFDPGDWDEIEVPGSWEVEGYGVPLYRDESYPFPADPPFIPHGYNPVGSYLRTFSVPEEWDGREVYLVFDGVRSAMYVWVNGQPVGYSQGSRTPADFRITEYLRPGENTLAVEVYRWSDGSYLEGQDMWRISGIQRDVYVYAASKLRVRDFEVRAELDDEYTDGRLSVDVEIEGVIDEGGTGTIAVDLLDAGGGAYRGSR